MDIQAHNKRLFLAALALACYVTLMVIAHMVFAKQNADRLSYAATVATLPSQFHDSMNSDEFIKLSQTLDQLKRGGVLSYLNPSIDALPLNVFLGQDRADLEAIDSLLKQQRMEPAKAKVELLAAKVKRAQRRQSRILSYLPWLAIVGVGLLTFLVLLAWLAQRTRISDEIGAASELVVSEAGASEYPKTRSKTPTTTLRRTAFNPDAPAPVPLGFADHLHAVVKEEVKFTGHRAALICEGFAEHQLPSHIESELAMIAEQLVRNSVEHGGRPAEQRIMAGKQDYLKIEVSLSESVNDYTLTVRDDGEGLDEEWVIARARELGLVSDKTIASLPPGQALKFIFLKGFNSPVAPLGVSENDMALDELRRLIREQGGTIGLQNLRGRFCQFSVRLPKLIA